jgi:hypothetical protein
MTAARAKQAAPYSAERPVQGSAVTLLIGLLSQRPASESAMHGPVTADPDARKRLHPEIDQDRTKQPPRARSRSHRGTMDVIQKIADRDEPFEVFIRDGDAEAVFGRDGEIDFGERVQTRLSRCKSRPIWAG